jgi:hypothetical protein
MFPLWPLSHLRHSALNTAICPLFPSTTLCLLIALNPLYGPLFHQQPSVSSTALCPLCKPLSLLMPSIRPSVSSTAIYLFPLHPFLCSLYGPLSPLYNILYILWPSIPSTTLCPLYDLISPLRPYAPIQPFISSKAICLLYGPLPPIRRSVPSTALGPLYSPLSSLQHFVLSPAPFPLCGPMFLYGPLSPLRPFAPSMALGSLFGFLSSYGPLFPQQPSVLLRPTFLATALCLLYCHPSPSKFLYPLFSPLFPSTIFCTLYGPLPPLRPSVLDMALCSLDGPVFPLWHSDLSMALCFLNRPLPSLLPSLLYSPYPLFGPLSP